MKKYIKSDDTESESYTTYEPDPYHRDLYRDHYHI